MTSRSECLGIFGKIFGHNHQPRYDTKEVLPPGIEKLSGGSPETLRAVKNIDSKYVGDVCIRCGSTVVRFEPEAGRL